PTSVAIKQVLAGIDIKGRVRVRVQGTEPYKLLPGTAAARGPVVPLQVFQQWQVLFESFQVRVHGGVSSRHRNYEESDLFPRQGWWAEEIS
ncbi:MAG: hypothetical protein WCF17_10220, partial [Terracidiphilus sp.]